MFELVANRDDMRLKGGIMWLYFIYYGSFIIVIPGIIISIICQCLISYRYKKYSKVQSRSMWNAHEMSDMILERQGINSVDIQKIRGNLTDNYNPSTDVLSLSEKVYDGTDIASLGVAAHECGHAVQKHTGSFLMTLRSILVPITNIGSRLAVPVAIIGVVLSFFINQQTADIVIAIGIAMYSLTTIFALVTLPVEIDASRRAIKMLSESGVLASDELQGAKKVLSAAAMTYVASLLISLLYLLRFIAIIGMTRNRRRD